MVKIKNPLLSLGARGLVGPISYLRRRKTNIAEKTPVVLDQHTPAQLSWRHMYQKCAALWHDLSAAEKMEWEALGTYRHMTGFAYWQSQCLRPNPGIYLPLQGGTMTGDIAMGTNSITGLPHPTGSGHATRKSYVDAQIAARGEGHITILPYSYVNIGQGAWFLVLNPVYYLYSVFSNAPGVNGDNISYQVYLAKGTYTLLLVATKGTSQCIIDFDRNATEIASFDLYRAPVNYNERNIQAGIVVATAGLYTLKMRVDGKNALSTGFNFEPGYIVLWRTA